MIISGNFKGYLKEGLENREKEIKKLRASKMRNYRFNRDLESLNSNDSQRSITESSFKGTIFVYYLLDTISSRCLKPKNKK